MTYTNIFEKILVILNIISTSWIYIAFSIISLLLLILLGFKKISKKTCFILITIATKLVLGYTVYMYYEPISNIINIIVDNIFLNIYFPSAYVYLIILLVINIVSIASLLKPRVEKVYKTVNGTCFIVTNFILALILEIIATEKVDIFKKESLFTNNNLITLLEFGINIFIIWIISLVTIYIINNITETILVFKGNKKLIKDPTITIESEIVVDEPKLKEAYQNETTNTILNPTHAIINEEQQKFIPNFTVTFNELVQQKEEVAPVTIIEENKFIPNNIIAEENKIMTDNTFDLSSFIPKKPIKPISVMENSINTNNVFEQLINNQIPTIKEEIKPLETTPEESKNKYTLNDYKIFYNMLKDIREHNQSNSVVINKDLEYRLITKYSTKNYDMFKTMLKIYN